MEKKQLEVQIVILDANLNIIEKGLVYPYSKLDKAKAEVVKINNLLDKQLIRSFKAYVMENV